METEPNRAERRQPEHNSFRMKNLNTLLLVVLGFVPGFLLGAKSFKIEREGEIISPAQAAKEADALSDDPQRLRKGLTATSESTLKEEQLDRNKDGMVDEIRVVLLDATGKEIMTTTKTDRDGDGGMDFWVKSITADGQRVFSETKSDKPKAGTRLFIVEGRVLLAEDDKDRDGIYETIVLYNQDNDIVGVLERTKSGEIVPASGETVLRETRNKSLFEQVVKPRMEKIMDQAKESQLD